MKSRKFASAADTKKSSSPSFTAGSAWLLLRVNGVDPLCAWKALSGVVERAASNAPVMDAPALWERIMDVTPMKKWMSEDEVCDWIEFLTLTNRSMSGQSLLIDNGEYDLRATFVWPEG